ncbi:MAG: DUF2442 domain-containing protein [Gemmatimonadetes bacterium]|nr:DUF2442 domain-containing protein [Gemmatimonadota bacterium]
MPHEIHRVTGFEKVAPFTLRVSFEDGTEQVIDFRPVLGAGVFEPLEEPAYFDRVRLDEEVGTLTWPNGADFDPDTLHKWPTYGPLLARRVRSWRGPDQAAS